MFLLAAGFVCAVLAVRKARYQRRYGPHLATLDEVVPSPAAWLVRAQVSGPQPLLAPFTGEACVAYHALVYALDGDERVNALELAKAQPFEVAAGGARLTVDAGRGTRLLLDTGAPAHAAVAADNEALGALLRAHDKEHRLDTSLSWCWRVSTLRTDDSVEVCGRCSSDGDGKLSLVPRLDGPLVVNGESRSMLA